MLSKVKNIPVEIGSVQFTVGDEGNFPPLVHISLPFLNYSYPQSGLNVSTTRD